MPFTYFPSLPPWIEMPWSMTLLLLYGDIFKNIRNGFKYYNKCRLWARKMLRHAVANANGILAISLEYYRRVRNTFSVDREKDSLN